MSELSMSSRKAARQGFTLIELLVVIAIIAILAAIIIPAVMAVQGQAQKAKDLEQIRGFGNGFTLYYKKYAYFPALTNMSATGVTKTAAHTADTVGGVPTTSLKLLMAGSFIEDAKVFFCPRDASPTEDTLRLMQVNLDPLVDPAWACTYSYDAGHNPNHGAVPFFGNKIQMLTQLGFDTLHVLTCEQVAKEMETDVTTPGKYYISNHEIGKTASVQDEVYTDDSATLSWRDAFMVDCTKSTLP